MLGFLTSGFTLNAGIKLVNEARAADAGAADALYQQAYDKFASIAATNGKYAQAIYHWGFGLLHQANNKSGDDAVRILNEAIDKFTVCQNVKPDYMGAAVDGGVAYLNIARIKVLPLDHEVYAKAKESFEKAETIQEGCASYNLACMYAMNNEGDAALRALEKARDLGLIPDKNMVLADDDLTNIRSQPWFDRFIESLDVEEEEAAKPEPAPARETTEAPTEETVAETEEVPAAETAEASETAEADSTDEEEKKAE